MENVQQRIRQLSEVKQAAFVQAELECKQIIEEAFPVGEYRERSLRSPLFELSTLLKLSGFPVSFIGTADREEDQGNGVIPNGALVRADNMSFNNGVKIFKLLKEFYADRTVPYDAQLCLSNNTIQNLGRDYLTKLRGEEAAATLKTYNAEFEAFAEFLLEIYSA